MAKKIIFNAIATLVNVLSGLLRNKIFAAFLTLNVFGILSIGQQSYSLLFTFFAFGLPLGITTIASHLILAPHEEQQETISRLVVLCIGFAAIVFVLILGVIMVAPGLLSKLVTNSPEFSLPVSILLLTAPLTIVQTCLYSIMEGMGKLKQILIFKILPSLIVLPLLYFLAKSYNIVGAAAGIAANEAVLVMIGIFLLRKEIRVTVSAMNVSPVLAKVFKVALLSFIVGVVWLVADFVVKRFILGKLGETDNAIVQSVAKVTDLYPNIALAWLSMHLFPELAKRKDNPRESALLIERTTLVAVGLIVPMILGLFILRTTVLEIIYKHEFTIAAPYFGAMLATGVPKVFSWVLGIAFLPLGFRKDWFATAMLFIGVYILGSWIGIANHLSIYFLPVVTGIGMTIQALYGIVLLAKRGLHFSTDFFVQYLMYVAMTALVGISVFWLPAIIIVAIVYSFLMYRYGVLNELLNKIYGLREKTA